MTEDTSRGYVIHINTVLERMVLLATPFEEDLLSDENDRFGAAGDETAIVEDTEEEGDEGFSVTKDEADVEEG